MRWVLVVLMWALVAAPGCLIFDEEDKPQGYTACGDFLADPGEDNYCPPGQYCVDTSFSECDYGCLSNENCAEDQRCVKGDGENVGTCQAKIKNRNPDDRRGLTPCGESFGEPVTCQPGQYCEDATFGRCEPGCTSDANCPSYEVCDREPGAAVGGCYKLVAQ